MKRRNKTSERAVEQVNDVEICIFNLIGLKFESQLIYGW